MSRNKPKAPAWVEKAHATAAVSGATLAATSLPESAFSENALSGNGKKLSDTALAFLYKEYDNLKDLYIQAEQTAQNIFNFYLTLITTITGGIVILLQISEKNALNTVQSLVTVSGMLLFAAIIGSVYISSITGRYAHMERYAYGMDQIRRFLIDRLNVPLPPVYQAFLERTKNRQVNRQRRSIWRSIFWLFPIGTYQLFIAAFNSLSLALGVGMFLFAGGEMDRNFGRGALVVGLIFGVSFFIYNIYSQWERQKLFRDLNVQFDSQGDLEWIAGKQ